MAVNLVQFKGATGGGVVNIPLDSNITVGNKIVLGLHTLTDDAVVVTDNLGNTYTKQARVGGVWGFSDGFIFVAPITTGGACIITVTHGPLGFFNPAYCIGEFSGLGDEIQGTIGIGNNATPPPMPGNNVKSGATGVVPTADTYIISLKGADGDSGLQYQSDTGDTLLGVSTGLEFAAMFGRQVSAPGLAYVSIQSSNATGSDSRNTLVSVAFSRPLTTPPGLTKQFAAHPGWGMLSALYVPAPTDGSNNKGAENTFSTMKRVHTFFPYPVTLGSLVLVTCIQNFSLADPPPFVLSDEYGNAYSLVGKQVANSSSVAVYKTVVTSLPAAGLPFKVSVEIVDTDPQAGTYCHPALVLAEYKGRGNSVLEFAGYDTIVNVGGGNYRIESDPLSVAEGAILFSIAAAVSPSDSVNWGLLSDYQSQLQWIVAQYSATVNRPRILCFVAMDKTALTADAYDSQVLVNNDTAEAMVLVSIPAPPPPPPGSLGVSRGLSILTSKQWATLREKGLRAYMPTDIYMDQEFPNAGFHLWPIPTVAHVIEFYYWRILAQFGAVTEDFELPPGFYDFLVFSLAIQLCGGYKRAVPKEILEKAMIAKKAVIDINAQIISGSYQESRTLAGPNIGQPQPKALGPLEPRLKPGAIDK